MAHKFSTEDFAEEAAKYFDFTEVIQPLAGYDDQNLLVRDDSGRKLVIKLCYSAEEQGFLIAQNRILRTLEGDPGLPKVFNNRDAQSVTKLQFPDGSLALLRALSFLEGEFAGESSCTPKLLESLGTFLGRLDLRLSSLDFLAIRQRRLAWDLRYLHDNAPLIELIPDSANRRLVATFFQRFTEDVLPHAHQLPCQTIHNDANDWNVLVSHGEVSGIIDFGDMVHSWRICELAIGLAYALFENEDPLAAAEFVIAGYHAENPLLEVEIAVLYALVAARLCITVCHAAKSRLEYPDDEYRYVSEKSAWKLLRTWIAIHPGEAENRFRLACGFASKRSANVETLLKARGGYISKAMSLAYQPEPLLMEGAALQYMYAADGKTYLDGVNNIMHVGHCHPNVVRAAQNQIAKLNTNTRYLYPGLTEYADRLCATLPKGLRKVFFVNSGSAATDLAIRLMRAFTGRTAVMVLEHGYHGNTSVAIDVSAYKYRGRGGAGPAGHVIEAPLPDLLRGSLAGDVGGTVGENLRKVAEQLRQAEESGLQLGGFIGETVVGCGGQIVLPEGYLQGLYQQVRAEGGVCIADEVQTGFGRVGSHFWAFEQHGVVPDMVILGKPMGNGHPMAAVVCTDKIAASFENGMEFFSSFGGNPVSCAIGLAVLDVIEAEGLQNHAQTVGNAILKDWRSMQKEFEEIGDARGSGLFLGLEMVKPGGGMVPDGELADQIALEMRRGGVLLSTDGPWHNVLKFKPPMPFSLDNAEQMNTNLREVIKKLRN
jgi:4-aminobutyrate aminotransferase-like enzyme/Ser/Thr protein kinase RdoA (MazF antagonist)